MTISLLRRRSLYVAAAISLLLLAACSDRLKRDAEKTFRIAAIVDTTTDPITREQTEALVALGDERLFELTGTHMKLDDFVESDSGKDMEHVALDYMAAHEGDLPNGLLIFSSGETGRAQINRGYSMQVAGPEGFSNDFVSPYSGDGNMYVAVLYFNYLYAACGYDGQQVIQSAVSFPGECDEAGGSACVPWQDMQICERAVPVMEGENRLTMAAGPLVHEYMHPFSDRGPESHYASEACNEIMGQPADYFDNDESDYYNGMCPDIYENFANSYRP